MMGDATKSGRNRGTHSMKSRRDSQLPVQNKGNLTMRDLERSKQIRELSENRLRSDISDLDNQEMNSILTIKRDQRILKEKLQNVQRSSGHYKTSSKGSGNEAQKQKLKNFDLSTNLPSLSDKQRAREVTFSEQKEKQQKVSDDSTNAAMKSQAKIVTDYRQSQPKDFLSLPAMRKMSKSEQNLHAAWYTNLDDVRSTINRRLSISMNDLSDDKSDIEKELEPFMFAVPDGLPRTMYMMPSINDRLSQAAKARYIRKPGTKLDPIERELNINAIFNKRNSRDHSS